MGEERFFYHSFPRPRAEEDASSTPERGLQILAYMKEVGLVLAPEVVQWDASALTQRMRKYKSSSVALALQSWLNLNYRSTAVLSGLYPSHSA